MTAKLPGTPGAWAFRALLLLATAGGCANTTTFHTRPLGARVYVNGQLCGESPCKHDTRYGFPVRIRVQIQKPGYESAEFFLDTEPPLASYLLFGFGSYLFHTFSEEYRFDLRPIPAPAASPPPQSIPPPSVAVPPAVPPAAPPPVPPPVEAPPPAGTAPPAGPPPVTQPSIIRI